MEKGYRYLAFCYLLLIPLMYLGFLQTYLSDFPTFEKNPGFAVHFHFVVSALWILLMVLQVFFVRHKKIQTHKVLGRISFLLFVFLITSFIPLYIKQLDYNILPLTIRTTSDMLSVFLFYSLAIYFRKKPAFHMRYMIALALAFALPAVSRINIYMLSISSEWIMFVELALVLVILFGLLLKDIFNERPYLPYGVAILFFVVRALIFYIAYFLERL